LLRWWLERARHPPPADPDPDTIPRAAPRVCYPRAPADRLTLTWIGHSTFLLQLGGLNILTDPIWSERASPLPWVGPRRRVEPGLPFDQLPAIDVVIQSHDHYDHLDDLTVCRLEARNPGARWMVPLGLGRFLERRGVHAITPLDWWQKVTLGEVSFTCTPAQHFSGRTPLGRNRTLWCGWGVAAVSHRLYFAGDTAYHPQFSEVAQRAGPFDVVLMPIGAYDPAWLMQPVHMNPEEAVAAYQDLIRAAPDRGTRFVPMHWGTFKLTDEPLDEPPGRILEAWARAELPPERCHVLAHGETLTL
jgi:N-acyl-phosphatidylethanolamine-hydrolysing phospholipase D